MLKINETLSGVEMNNNGLIVSVVEHRGMWLVTHCARIGKNRFGKASTKRFSSEEDAMDYAKSGDLYT